MLNKNIYTRQYHSKKTQHLPLLIHIRHVKTQQHLTLLIRIRHVRWNPTPHKTPHHTKRQSATRQNTTQQNTTTQHRTTQHTKGQSKTRQNTTQQNTTHNNTTHHNTTTKHKNNTTTTQQSTMIKTKTKQKDSLPCLTLLCLLQSPLFHRRMRAKEVNDSREWNEQENEMNHHAEFIVHLLDSVYLFAVNDLWMEWSMNGVELPYAIEESAKVKRGDVWYNTCVKSYRVTCQFWW